MVRRDFLKLSGLMTAAMIVQATPALAAASQPVQAEVNGMLYRGTDDGRIYTSANGGKSWKLHTNFGSDLAVWGLAASPRGDLRLQLGFAGHSILLSLMPDRKTWQTA